MTIDEMDNLLNKQSGLIGLSGVNDFRDLQQLAPRATASASWLDVYCTGSSSTSARISRCSAGWM